MTSFPLDAIRKLSPEERVQLVEDIWDTLVDDTESLPVTDAQAAELDRRLEAYAKDSDPGTPWEQVKADLRAEM